MTNPYLASRRVTAENDRFYIHREHRRYELAAGRFREAGLTAYADLFADFAEQALLEIEAMAKMDARLAALDAKLAGDEVAA